MPKRWRIATHDPARIAQLERAAGLPPVLAQLLIARGIDCPNAAREFLEPKLTGLRDPEVLPGVSLAADEIGRAVRDREKIAVYGDYDADGMTAAAILLRCLRLLGADARLYVPHRIDEGYGLNADALRRLAEAGIRTVVTVDCGVASVAEAALARELGLRLVITDHHQMADRLPDAAAIVHPKLPTAGDPYPFDGLCGAAVAFKLAWALCQRASHAKRVGEPMRRFLLQATGLAAIGTVADVVPLIDENRILVRHGLAALRHSPTVGFAELEKVAGLTKKPALEGEDLGFSVAPRLNAAGRLGQAELAVELLTTDDPARAAELAAYVDELNETRKTVERSVLLAARKEAKQCFSPDSDPALVLAGRDWHPGVIGIVAGKLAEQYAKPVVVISLDKLGAKPAIGSGRSVPGFNLCAALAAAGEHLASHGGHAAAAGLRVDESRLEAFRIDFCAHAASVLGPNGDAAELAIDAEAPLSSLTHQTVAQIERLAPFGHGNQRPTLCCGGVRLASAPRPMGGGRHLSVDLVQSGVKLRAVAFGAGEREEELRRLDGPFEVAFRPVINTFRGYRSVEMHLADWKAGESGSF
ncbi:single-stranded-DNA-specific exonuclease RecJ [Botrimarina sp.]|uniref:single-stranded-DNA-specific exonuclease RecJ n=1 Tax=Botrimarina sp. TaxID=2795802 RepID=UPI0032ECFA82